MPFLAIILDSDIILGSFCSKIIKIRVLEQKSLSTKKKGPLPGSLQTVVRSGEAPPDGPFSQIRELANSKHVLMKIHQNPIQVWVNK